jgi:hypothetical protein
VRARRSAIAASDSVGDSVFDVPINNLNVNDMLRNVYYRIMLISP